jgi:hypothetical protein
VVHENMYQSEKKFALEQDADLLQTKSVPKLYCFAIFLRTFLRNICTKEVEINWYKAKGDVINNLHSASVCG